jgi:methyl-accepting chemotaxis protein
MLSQLKIRARFLLLVAAFVIGLTGYGVWSFRTLHEVKVTGPIYGEIVMDHELLAQAMPPNLYIIDAYLTVWRLAQTAASDETQRAQLLAVFAQQRQAYEKAHATWLIRTVDPTIAQPLLERAHQAALALFDRATKELPPALAADDREEVRRILSRLDGTFAVHREQVELAVQGLRGRTEAAEAHTVNLIRRDAQVQTAVLLGFLLLCGGLALVIAQSIVRPLRRAVELAQHIAAGDLRAKLLVMGRSEMTELMAALRDMQTSLVSVVARVRQGAEAVAGASAEIAMGNQDLSTRTEQQATALEETSASMRELGDAVHRNAQSAGLANAQAVQASDVARRGGDAVAQVVGSMREIQSSSDRIADIIGVIDGIAFQTNILALNAAVEAARAGESGCGFAVVAGEVRALARRSAEAAREIKTLIGTSVQRVEAGGRQADQAGLTMDEVVLTIGRATAIMGEISAASAEQAEGVAQVGLALGQIDQVTHQNAALVEQMAAAAAALRQQAQELVSVVVAFRLNADETKVPVDIVESGNVASLT